MNFRDIAKPDRAEHSAQPRDATKAVGALNVFAPCAEFDEQLTRLTPLQYRLVPSRPVSPSKRGPATAQKSPLYLGVALGTRIETAIGPEPVENIRAGYLVKTAGGGTVPVLQVTTHLYSSSELAAYLCPGDRFKGTGAFRIGRRQMICLNLWEGDLLFGRSDVAFRLDDVGLSYEALPCTALFRLWFDEPCYVQGEGVSYRMPAVAGPEHRRPIAMPLELKHNECQVLASYLKDS